jgi:hypothetical protein
MQWGKAYAELLQLLEEEKARAGGTAGTAGTAAAVEGGKDGKASGRGNSSSKKGGKNGSSAAVVAPVAFTAKVDVYGSGEDARDIVRTARSEGLPISFYGYKEGQGR